MNKIPNETRISERSRNYPSEPQMEVPYQFTPALPEILTHLNASLVVSTYQAGKVLVIGVHDQQLQISFLDFDQPMGIAAGRDKIAIGTKSEIQFFQGNHRAAANISPRGAFDGCFVAHTSRHTGRILGHDLARGTEGLWIVNTLFSCRCTLDDKHSFVPRSFPRPIFNPEGQLTSQFDERGTETRCEYDSHGRQKLQRLAYGTTSEAQTETLYDPQGNVSEVRSPRYFDATDTNGYQKAKETYTYTGRNRVKTHTEAPSTAEAATESFTYDLKGRQSTHTDFASKV